MALPPTFKGYLRLTSTNGSIQLGDSLQANSKLLSGDNQKDLLYFITPSSSSFDLEDESVEKVDFAQVDDSCHCSSVSGRIEVDYYGSVDGEEDIDKEQIAWSRVAERQCCVIN